MLGNSQFAEYDTRPVDQLPHYIAERLTGMHFNVTAVDLRQSRSLGGLMVNVTLGRPAGLNALFAAEQFLAPQVAKMVELPHATFFWRYRPTATTGATA